MKQTFVAVVLACLSAVVGWFLRHFDQDRNEPTLQVGVGIRSLSPDPTRIDPITGTNYFDWRSVESSDYLQYIARLRQIGCPPETVADIIVADVNQLYNERARDLRKCSVDSTNDQFWKTVGRAGVNPEPIYATKLQLSQLDSERKRVLRELLADDATDEKLAAVPPELAWSAEEEPYRFLPLEKRDRVRGLQNELAARARTEVGSSGIMTSSVKARLQQIEREMEARLPEILTAEEKEQYNLRVSPTAQKLRLDLDGFEPTEAEFRAIFKAQKRFDDAYSLVDVETASELREKVQLQKEVRQEIRQSLGDARFADYQRVQDIGYHMLRDFAASQDLPGDWAKQTYDRLRGAELQTTALHAQAASESALSSIRRQAEETVLASLPEAKRPLFLNDRSSEWLKTLGDSQPRVTEAVPGRMMFTVPEP